MNKEQGLKILRNNLEVPTNNYDEGYNDGLLKGIQTIRKIDTPDNYHKLNENNKEVINKVIDCLVEDQLRREKQNVRNQICKETVD